MSWKPAIKINIALITGPYLYIITDDHECSIKVRSHIFLIQSSQIVLVIKFQVISRFCPGQKGHSPGYSVNTFGTKR